MCKDWSAIYTIDGKTCAVRVMQRVGGSGMGEKLCISIKDDVAKSDDGFDDYRYDFMMEVLRAKERHGDILKEVNHRLYSINYDYHRPLRSPNKRKKTINARGGITETVVYSYGSETKRKVLIVVETKRKSDSDSKYCMITVAPYFVVTTKKETLQLYCKKDIGLSLVVQMRDDTLSSAEDTSGYAIEGPIQHPAAALLYLIDQVKRTVSWTPTLCPHCANSDPRQRVVYAESDSEDSDNQWLWSKSNRKNGGASFLGNHGVNKGTGNGSVYVKKVLVGH